MKVVNNAIEKFEEQHWIYFRNSLSRIVDDKYDITDIIKVWIGFSKLGFDKMSLNPFERMMSTITESCRLLNQNDI